jgi:hypothetical protein
MTPVVTVPHECRRPARSSPDLDGRSDRLGRLPRLVDLAVGSDDAPRFIAAAAEALGGPLGVVAVTGEALGYAPDDAHGRRALAVAAAAARTPVITPPGWRVISITHAGCALASLAVGETEGGSHSDGRLLELTATLLGEQLKRVALVRGRTAAFARRLVSDAGIGPEQARQEGAEVGVALADAYWPAVLSWNGTRPRPGVLSSIDRQAGLVGGLTATVEGRLIVLHPGGQSASDAMAWFEQLVARVRTLAPSSQAQAIVSDEAVPVGELSGQVAKLLGFCCLRRPAHPARPVISARQYALERLLWETLPTLQARAFVEDCLGPLIAWDREHGSDLLQVLEAALDFPRHDRAASRCFMHRNTFRHRLRQATQVLGLDLEDPDVRFAVHVALRLRALVLGAARDRGAPIRSSGTARGADAAPGAGTVMSPPRTGARTGVA